ncbi:hypothetical protein BASA62_009656 [Batrachochytrium salamandrivorans]|nr:hypothetical protein BASA62_009656 [Batrachochytrium salamandrivorans]
MMQPKMMDKQRLSRRKAAPPTAAASNTNAISSSNRSATPSISISAPVNSSTDTTESMAAVDPMPALAEQIRSWRDDALYQSQLDAAVFWGGKAVDMTAFNSHSSSEYRVDVYQLAFVHFRREQYLQAELLLKDNLLAGFSVWGGCLTAQCLIKQGKEEEALYILGIETMPCILDKGYHYWRDLDSTLSEKYGRNLKIEASVAYFRGLARLQLNQNKSAQLCFISSLRIDFRSYQALDALLQNHLLSDKEKRTILDSLGPNTGKSYSTEFIRLVYQSRINQFTSSVLSETSHNDAVLLSRFNLSQSTDTRLAEARKQYIMADYQSTLEITTTILHRDPHNMDCLLLYISSLMATGNTAKLFLKAHELTEQFPNNRISWYAVATYYLAAGKYWEAQSYFSKCTTISPTFVEAWVGFGHTFALLGIHDQAIASYSTASRISNHMHTPSLYLGMQYLSSNNLELAMKFLTDAYSKCDSDPILLNELGVLYYRQGKYADCIKYLERVSKIINGSQMKKRNWEMTVVNLGHAYRKQGEFVKAQSCFETVISEVSQHAPSYAALGLMAHTNNRLDEAIRLYHQALSIDPKDPISNEMLRRALVKASSTSTDMTQSFLTGVADNMWRVSSEDLEHELSLRLGDVDDQFDDRENTTGGLDAAGLAYSGVSYSEALAEGDKEDVQSQEGPLKRSGKALRYLVDSDQDDLTTPVPMGNPSASMSLWRSRGQDDSGANGATTRSMAVRDRASIVSVDADARPSIDSMLLTGTNQPKRGLLDFTASVESGTATADGVVMRRSRDDAPPAVDGNITPPRASRAATGGGSGRMRHRALSLSSSPIASGESNWITSTVFDHPSHTSIEQVNGGSLDVSSQAGYEYNSADSDMSMDLDDNE